VLFREQHEGYVAALDDAGVRVTRLDPLEEFPDSVFIEDAALCLGDVAILMRPGAPTRFGESAALRPTLQEIFSTVIELPAQGDAFIEAGDILVTDDEVLVGLSARTNPDGFRALRAVVGEFGYRARRVETPTDVLHFKTDCGLLDSETVFATRRLAASGCFSGLRVVEAPAAEEAAANLIRVNERVLMSSGYPQTEALLSELGYSVVALPTGEAAKVDGGPSCLSLRFSRTD